MTTTAIRPEGTGQILSLFLSAEHGPKNKSHSQDKDHRHQNGGKGWIHTVFLSGPPFPDISTGRDRRSCLIRAQYLQDLLRPFNHTVRALPDQELLLTEAPEYGDTGKSCCPGS